jgi:hypothetical protein
MATTTARQMPLVMAEDSPVERSANRPATNALKQHEPNQVNVVVSSSNRKSRGSTLAFRDGHDDETKTTTKTTTKTKIETATTKGGNRQHSIIAVPEQAVVDNTKDRHQNCRSKPCARRPSIDLKSRRKFSIGLPVSIPSVDDHCCSWRDPLAVRSLLEYLQTVGDAMCFEG